MKTTIIVEFSAEKDAGRLLPDGDWLPLPPLLSTISHRIKVIKADYKKRKRGSNG